MQRQTNLMLATSMDLRMAGLSAWLRTMRTTTAKLLLLGTALVGAAAHAQPTLRVGIEGNLPPFHSLDASGALVGFDVDIARALCDEMHAKCVYVVQDSATMTTPLLANKLDLLISSVFITEEGKQQLDFSKPYYIESAVFIAAEATELNINFEGLKGKKVGVVANSIFEKMANEKFPTATAKPYASMAQLTAGLAHGQIDAVLAPQLVALLWLKTAQGKDYEIKGKPFMDAKFMGQGVGVGLRKGNTALLAQVNTALDALFANGKYAAINKKYFPISIAP